ncbi:MAG: FtsQ-type POTRA domain-containing protein, partial [Pseudomonadales bacterium]|nr:FtsQ-type POTRA domain-containing protein [Pseudomonadales bacterium]
MFNRLLFAVVVLSIVVVAAGLWHTLDKPVQGFVIEGDLSGMERAELQAALSDTALQGILSTRLDAIVSRVQSLHWAKDISIRRAWPDRFVVTLHKAAPVARWGDSQYVSAYGDLLELPDVYPGLPHFMVDVS